MSRSSPDVRGSALGEPFCGGPASVGGPAQEAAEQLEPVFVILRADLVHRVVHPRVDEVETEDLRAPAARRPDDHTAGVGGRAARGRGAEILRLYLVDSGMNDAMDQICAEYDEDGLELLGGFLRRTADAG